MTDTPAVAAAPRRRIAVATSLLAAVAALTFGGAASGAWAADWNQGHIDFVSVAANGSSALKLGSNPNDTGWVGPTAYTLKVKSSSGSSGTGFIIPQTEAEANSRGVPWAGFSGDPGLRDVGFVTGDTVTIKLESVTFTPKPGTSGTGTVSISQSGTPWFTGNAKTHVFTASGSDDEIFHEHTKWVFSQAGTYQLKFSATGKGRTAPAVTYTVKAGV